MSIHRLNLAALAAAILCAVLPTAGYAQTTTPVVIQDTLTGASSSFDWVAINGACLTAGGSTTVTHNYKADGTFDAANSNPIPACNGLSYYSGKTQVGGWNGTLPDNPGTLTASNPTGTPGNGALRLSNGDTVAIGSNGNNQTGAVISNFTFPSNQGLNVTFTAVSYGGNALNGTGADGLSFFLLDDSYYGGAKLAPSSSTLGAFGGSLGYSCSQTNTPYNGIVGGYLGIGIDEYGNFPNNGDNTASTAPGVWGGTNTKGGFRPGNISVRGAGNVNQITLGGSTSNIQSICKTGKNGTTAVLDYPLLASNLMPATQPISNQEAPQLTPPSRANAVPITYQINITQNNRLTVQYSYAGAPAVTVINNQPITTQNGTLPANFRFGFAAGTGGGSNVHEIMCFKAKPSVMSSSSAGSNTQQSTPISGGAQAYLALANPLGNWGQLTANSLQVDKNGNPSIASLANWDAGCTLTGTRLFSALGGDPTKSTPTCPATGSALGTAEAITSSGASGASGTNGRNLLTWGGSAGMALTWTNPGSSSGSPLLALNAGDGSTPLGSTRLPYLRGDRSNEITTSKPNNPFRRRVSVLGDIINSSPTWVGPPAQSAYYGTTWKDKIDASTAPTPAENSDANGGYKGFANKNATRTNVVYVGANDGFLHAFRAGSFDANGKWASMPNGTGTGAANDGYELLGYMPSTALATIHGNPDATNSTSSSINVGLDFSSPSYQHAYFVDATPGTGDLYYGKAWHTWLVGGMGAGANYGGPVNSNSANNNSSTGAGGAIYALEITNPNNFSESNAATVVMGDWNASSLSCTSMTGTRTGVTNATCGQNLGNTFGTPVIRRLHDGNWAIIFGNGLNSQTGAAGIYVMTIPQSTTTTVPTPVIRFIDTGTGTPTAKNGIVQTTAADIDGDSITDYVYAGDVQGNVWRFDLTSSDPTQWAVRAKPLFTTKSGQPITTAITATPVAVAGGNPRIMLDFGTGQQFPSTATNKDVTYATAQQALYGIWDWDMGDWNKKGSAQYTYLSATGTGAPSATIPVSSLTQQTMGTGTPTSNGEATRTMSNNTVCWMGSSTCTSGNTQFGWTAPLSSVTTGSGTSAVTNYEQVIYNPQINFGYFMVNTTIPGAGNALTCSSQTVTGYSMAITVDQGAAPTVSFFTGTAVNLAGIAINAVGTAFFVSDNSGNYYMVNQTASPNSKTNQFGDIRKTFPISGFSGKQLNWLKQR